MKYQVLKTEEFEEWLEVQQGKVRTMVLARLDMLRLGHFGNYKRFDGLIELRWLNGTRVYRFCGEPPLLLLSTEEIKMAKTETLKKQKKSVMKSLRVHVPFASKELKDVSLVTETLLDCIKTGDLDAFREVLAAHLMTANKVEIARRSGVGRRTLYDMMDPDKEFNPELSTVSAVIRALEPVE